MITHFASLQLALDLLGVFVFAISGGLLGIRKGLDLFGVLVLAVVTALGGGVVRDLLLQVQPVGVYDWKLVTTAAAGGLASFWATQHVVRYSRPIKALDAAGMALFAVSGSLKAVSMGATPVASVIVGVITAVGGGIIRDLLAGVVPDVLRRELYAVPAALGSAIVVAAASAHVLADPVVWIAVAASFGLRILGIVKRWEAPRARTVLADNS